MQIINDNSAEVTFCDKCVVLWKRIPSVTLEPTNRYSVDGCDACLDGKAGHEVYLVTFKGNLTH